MTKKIIINIFKLLFNKMMKSNMKEEKKTFQKKINKKNYFE